MGIWRVEPLKMINHIQAPALLEHERSNWSKEMGYNTPDDCPWTSDLDYRDAMRSRFDEHDTADDFYLEDLAEEQSPVARLSKCPRCGYYAFDGYECFDCGFRPSGMRSRFDEDLAKEQFRFYAAG